MNQKSNRDIIISFILAGKDSTSTVLTWFFWLLTANPSCVTQIQREIPEAEAAAEAGTTTDEDGDLVLGYEGERYEFSTSGSVGVDPAVPTEDDQHVAGGGGRCAGGRDASEGAVRPLLSLRQGEDGGGVGGWRAESSHHTGGWMRGGVRGGEADQVRGVPRANGVAMCLGGRWRTYRSRLWQQRWRMDSISRGCWSPPPEERRRSACIDDVAHVEDEGRVCS